MNYSILSAVWCFQVQAWAPILSFLRARWTLCSPSSPAKGRGSAPATRSWKLWVTISHEHPHHPHTLYVVFFWEKCFSCICILRLPSGEPLHAADHAGPAEWTRQPESRQHQTLWENQIPAELSRQSACVCVCAWVTLVFSESMLLVWYFSLKNWFENDWDLWVFSVL